jgi:outer membrane protein OmpA-like peptidoglycan-associated protein
MTSERSRMCAGRARIGIVLALFLLLCGSANGPDAARAQGSAALLERASARLEEADDLGAKRHLPNLYRVAEAALRSARGLAAGQETAGSPESRRTAAAALRLAERLAVQAALVDDLRQSRDPWEAVVEEQEQTLRRLAAAAGVTLPDSLAGREASRALERLLARRTTGVRLAADSLAVAHRLLKERCESELSARDSALTAAQVELSSLRRQLWQTELRAGMAEADRTAAESVLDREEARRDAIRAIGRDFGPDEGEVLLTPTGDVIVRVHGFAFAVGSAAMPANGPALVAKLADAVARFPQSPIRIEGHTDNTGGRDANLRLSRRRAETVAAALQERISLPPEQVEIVGHGPDLPVATNETPEGRARNRRIDVVIRAGGS